MNMGKLIGLIQSVGASASIPQRGVDYWTEADIAAIHSYLDEMISNGSW